MSFRKFFRNEYMTDPGEEAYQGYDAVMLIAKGMADKSGELNVSEYQGLFSTYRFKTVAGVNENQFIHMVKYEGYKLVEAK